MDSHIVEHVHGHVELLSRTVATLSAGQKRLFLQLTVPHYSTSTGTRFGLRLSSSMSPYVFYQIRLS